MMKRFKTSTGDVLMSRSFAFDVKRGEEKRVCVCICTYKRPELLKHLLSELANQETAGFFTYSIVVVDSDYLESAKQVVTEFASMSLSMSNTASSLSKILPWLAIRR